MFFTNLETERLILKVIDNEDAEFFFKQFSNDEVNRYLFDTDPCTSVEEASEWIEFFNEDEPRNQNRWILIKKETGEKIGTCGFHCWNRKSAKCEVGWDLYPDYWKQGYMTEAMKAILEFAQKNMQIKSIEANIAEGNMNSIKMAQKNGFEDVNEDYMEEFHGKEYLHKKYGKVF